MREMTTQPLPEGPLHFIGVGGYGMSGLALVLAAAGRAVSGCDVQESSRVQWLRSHGVDVKIGHDRSHLQDVGGVIYSTDVPPHNVERQAAGDRGIPLLHRSEVLAHLLDTHAMSIAVAGTHGKTSTTALLGSVLEAAGWDPTIIVGGEMRAYGSTARVGASDVLVAEACESDATFLRYTPAHMVITNIEPEHLEHYPGGFEEQCDAFLQFIRQVRPGGYVVVNGDDPVLRRLLAERDDVIWCSSQGDSAADYRVTQVVMGAESSTFSVEGRREGALGSLTLSLVGEHMIANALQVVALTLQLGVSLSAVTEGLLHHRGVKRRFEFIGRVKGATVVDDYAHHPTEIAATLATARRVMPGRVLAVFQPQRYSRTRQLFSQFATCFSQADALILMPIYSPPGQEMAEGLTTEDLAARIRSDSSIPVEVMQTPNAIIDRLREELQPGDLLLTMGAGDVWRIAHQLVDTPDPIDRVG